MNESVGLFAIVGRVRAGETGAKKVICTWTIRVEVCCKVVPHVGSSFGGRAFHAEVYNSVKIKVLGR